MSTPTETKPNENPGPPFDSSALLGRMGLSIDTVWLSAWTAVANAFNCDSPEAATRWADACVEAYRERWAQRPNDQAVATASKTHPQT